MLYMRHYQLYLSELNDYVVVEVLIGHSSITPSDVISLSGWVQRSYHHDYNMINVYSFVS